MDDSIELLARALEEVGDGFLVVVTGAGISLASGISTFRGTDKDAIWTRDTTELATFAYFSEDPVGSWQWYSSRFDSVRDARPNPGHRALVALERWQLARGRFLLVTQNVDTLHEQAGARQLVKVHGSSDRVRCPAQGCRHGAPTGSLPRDDFDLEAFRATPALEHLPRCPACGEILRQHVLWFDEYYGEHQDYQWTRVQQAAATMSLGLFVGTSFAVGVTDLFARSGMMSRIPLLSVDPGAARPPYPGIEVLPERAEELLPAVCERLGAEVAA